MLTITQGLKQLTDNPWSLVFIENLAEDVLSTHCQIETRHLCYHLFSLFMEQSLLENRTKLWSFKWTSPGLHLNAPLTQYHKCFMKTLSMPQGN